MIIMIMLYECIYGYYFVMYMYYIPWNPPIWREEYVYVCLLLIERGRENCGITYMTGLFAVFVRWVRKCCIQQSKLSGKSVYLNRGVRESWAGKIPTITTFSNPDTMFFYVKVGCNLRYHN